jgi:hypothetical protein
MRRRFGSERNSLLGHFGGCGLVVERVVAFGFVALTFGALFLAGSTVTGRARPWLVQYRAWMKSTSFFSRFVALAGTYAFLLALLWAELAVLRQLQLLAPEWMPYWPPQKGAFEILFMSVFWGLFMAFMTGNFVADR